MSYAIGSHSGLFVAGGAVTQALSTTPAKLTGFTGSILTSDQDASIAPDVANDEVDLLAGGTYLVLLNVSAQLDTAAIQAIFSLAVGGVVIDDAKCRLESPGAIVDTPLGASSNWILKPAAAAVLSVFVESESGTPDLTLVDAQLTVIRLK